MMKFIKNLKLQNKLLLVILSVSMLTYIISMGYVTFNLKDLSFTDAQKIVDGTAQEYANQVKAELNKDFYITKSMAHSFARYQDVTYEKRIEYYNSILKEVILKNPDFLSTWINWDLSSIDTTWDKSYGRRRLTYYLKKGEVVYKDETLNTDGQNLTSTYYQLKESKKDIIMEPYWFAYLPGEPEVLEASIAISIVVDNKFRGLVGIDLDLNRFKKIIEKIKPFENSFAFLISNNGTYVSHPDDSIIGKNILEINKKDVIKHDVLKRISKGEKFSFMANNDNSSTELYVSFAPFTIGNTDTPWSLGVAVPVDVISKQSTSVFWRSILIGVLGIIALSIAIIILSRKIAEKLKKITTNIKLIGQGVIDNSTKVMIESKDEVGEMSDALNNLIDSLITTSNFAKEIGKGNINADFKVLSDKDVLGNSLLDMRTSLKQAQDDENKRKIEDDKRNWATQGIATFGELLRQNSANMQELSFNIILNLVKYLKANQGGIFVLNDENKNEPFIELAACYAYDRRKFLEKKIEMGDGLVGTCFLEKQTIYITNVPDDYVNITSGLGHSNPKSILIVPLKINEEIFGVLEIASFENFEKYHIDFIEKVCESIASTISSVKVNIRTQYLLKQSQLQSEQMRSQEEEMRQNLEEIHATQEEMARKTAELESILNAINTASYIIVYDLEGKIISINDAYLNLFGVRREQIIGTHHSDNLHLTDEQRKEYKKFWEDLRKGIIKKETHTVLIKGQTFWFNETYGPILDANGNTIKIFKIANDITDVKMQEVLMHEQQEKMKDQFDILKSTQDEMVRKENLMQVQLDTINKAVAVLEYDHKGYILSTNNLFSKISGYNESELIGKHHSILFDNKNWENSDAYKEYWNTLNKGEFYENIMKRISHNGKPFFIKGVCNPVFEGNVLIKVIEFTVDITKEFTKQQDLIKEITLKSNALQQQEEELRQNLEEINALEDDLNKNKDELEKNLKRQMLKNVKMSAMQKKSDDKIASLEKEVEILKQKLNDNGIEI